jgi:hypothetical protein
MYYTQTRRIVQVKLKTAYYYDHLQQLETKRHDEGRSDYMSSIINRQTRSYLSIYSMCWGATSNGAVHFTLHSGRFLSFLI